MSAVLAVVQNGRMDILAANALGDALYLGFGAITTKPANFARFVFLDPRAPEFYDDWERAARDCVAMLRLHAGRSPEDTELSALVGELSVNSEQFRQWWARHDVRVHNIGTKSFHHPIVGDLTVAFESLEFAADPGQMLVTYTAESMSRSSEALRLLASWSATPAHERSASTASPLTEIRPAE